jgi:pilus assembly protein Flp/PilA
MKRIIKALLKDRSGTSAIEMGLICALIVLAMLTALQNFADGSNSMWNNVSSKSAAAMGGNAA